MHSWRVILACALVALIATAFAQDDAQCKKDGEAEGAKLATELCTSAKASCDGGETPDKSVRRTQFDTATACGRVFFDACFGQAEKLVEPCASFKGDDKCELADFEYIYRERKGPRCLQAANKYSPAPPRTCMCPCACPAG